MTAVQIWYRPEANRAGEHGLPGELCPCGSTGMHASLLPLGLERERAWMLIQPARGAAGA